MNGHMPAADIIEYILDLERRLSVLERVNPLENSSIGHGGLTVMGGGSIVVEGGEVVVKDGTGTPGVVLSGVDATVTVQEEGSLESDEFDGDLAADDLGTTGWAVGAGIAVFDTLALRSGAGTVIDNDAMAVEDQVFIGSSTWETFAATTIPVPSWATTAQVFVTVGATFSNPTSSNDIWAGFCRGVIEGNAGADAFAHVPAMRALYVGASHARTMDVTAVDVLDVAAEGKRSFGTAPDAQILSGWLTAVVLFSVVGG